ncbi:MAG: type I secretion system permease/ATPase [Pseudomonadota bacterium]
MNAPELKQTALDAALRRARMGLVAVGVFSCFLNLLYLASPIYMMQLFDRVLTSGSQGTLLWLTVIVVFAMATLGALDAMRAWLLSRIGVWVAAVTSGPVIDKTIRASLLADGPRGAQPMRDLKQLQGFLSGQGAIPLFDAPWIPIFLFVIWSMHPALGVLGLVCAAILAGLSYLNELATRKALEKGAHSQLSGFGDLESYLRNAEVIEALGMTRDLLGRWRTRDAEATAAQEVAAERGAVVSGVSKFARMTAQVAVLGLGAKLVLEGQMAGGGMIAASILLGRALAPLEQLIGAWKQCVAARMSHRRVQTLLRDVEDRPQRMTLPAPSGLVEVENLIFRLNTAAPPILKGVSFALQPGEVMGLIGPSAAGKTTLCRLIAGVYPPTAGNVRLDGADVFEWDKADLANYVGYLPQDVELFAGTIAENIARMGAPDGERVLEAAKYAEAHDMIVRIPGGYDAVIGERGAGLSAGQRQRIGLARALYCDPRLLILDEPNANLDHVGEEALQRAIRSVKEGGGTVVLVAHRPSALVHADKVLILQAGKVAAFGPRDEVLSGLNQKARKPRPDHEVTQQEARTDYALGPQ